MSQENVELVEEWISSFEGDADAFQATLHPEIEWFPFEDNHTRFYGIDGAMRIRNSWLDTWDEMRADLEEVVEGGDSVVASRHITGGGKMLTPTPEPARYCAGDVAGERGDRARGTRRAEPARHRSDTRLRRLSDPVAADHFCPVGGDLPRSRRTPTLDQRD